MAEAGLLGLMFGFVVLFLGLVGAFLALCEKVVTASRRSKNLPLRRRSW